MIQDVLNTLAGPLQAGGLWFTALDNSIEEMRLKFELPPYRLKIRLNEPVEICIG
jgi:hypothetical protein